MPQIKLPWNPARVLNGLSKIGYSPTEAILDIVDNSVSAGASRIDIQISIKSTPSTSGRGRRAATLDRILIRDDGCGMDHDGLVKALTLGTDSAQYQPRTLSKFGLGLKSAAGSLGECLTLTSKVCKSSPGNVAILDHAVVAAQQEYVCEVRPATRPETARIASSGTEVVISRLHEELPHPSKVRDSLKEILGLTYCFFIKPKDSRKPLSIYLDDELVPAIDPLFCDLIAEGANLDENTWDGLTPQWLLRTKHIQIDENSAARFTVTQLPHPPSFAVNKSAALTQAEARDRYLIGAPYYGIYIYRNDRLISRADDLGIISQSQDLYAYRGRLEIDSSADDALHIDVAKSQISLSQLAHDQIMPDIYETTRKSRNAWHKRTATVGAVKGADETGPLNSKLDEVAREEAKASKEDIEATPAEERAELATRSHAVEQRSALDIQERDAVAQQKRRVLYEGSFSENELWRRKIDAELGVVAVVNQNHRLVTDLLNSPRCPTQLKNVFEFLMFGCVEAETLLLKRPGDDLDHLDRMLQEYRISVGERLSFLLRRVGTSTLLGE